MKILIITDNLVTTDYAPTIRALNLANALKKFGIETLIIPMEKDLPPMFKKKGRLNKYLRRIYLFFYMFSIIKRKKIQYIFSIGFYIGLEAIILAKILGCKTIFEFHGYVYEEEIHRGHRIKPFFTKFLEQICLKYSNIVVTQTINNKILIRGLNKNTFVVENGINLDEFEGLNYSEKIFEEYSITRGRPLIGFIGNWENWMNIEDLLFVSKYLNNLASIIIIGKGRNLRKYKDAFKNVIFTGRISHEKALNFLINFDICILPHSKDEIMKYKSAMKTFEYMAAGKPIIVSNVTGKEDFLINGKNCLTYEPGNPKDLAKNIEFLLDNKELMALIGLNNRAMAKRFSWEKNLKRSGLLNFLKEK